MPAVEMFDVDGTGQFPVDMLRYDSCWPARGEDAAMIAASFTWPRRRRKVSLHGVNNPTAARWASFGWEVV